MSECEEFWAGKFGDDYSNRNSQQSAVGIRREFFSRCLGGVVPLGVTAIEFGPNVGNNLMALRLMGVAESDLYGIEINKQACEALRVRLPLANIANASALQRDFTGTKMQHDYVLSLGFLIHQSSDKLGMAMGNIFHSCKVGGRIIIGEYFAPVETEVLYRGHEGKLWRRDYGGMMVRMFRGMCAVESYGFVSKDDPVMPMDDINFWVIKRTT